MNLRKFRVMQHGVSTLNSCKTYVLTSWDDTLKIDLKVAMMLEAYGLKGTFYVVTNYIGKKIGLDDLKYLSMLHEIGAHTMSHPRLCRISEELARKEIFDSKYVLEQLLDMPKRSSISFAYTYGEYKEKHVKMVKEAGFCCARTTEPFHIEYPKNLLKMPVSVCAYPHALKNVRDIFRLSHILPGLIKNPFVIKDWSTIAKKLFDITLSNGGVFHLFGHAWQIDKFNYWKELEDVFSHLANHREVIYTTVARFCDLIKLRV